MQSLCNFMYIFLICSIFCIYAIVLQISKYHEIRVFGVFFLPQKLRSQFFLDKYQVWSFVHSIPKQLKEEHKIMPPYQFDIFTSCQHFLSHTSGFVCLICPLEVIFCAPYFLIIITLRRRNIAGKFKHFLSSQTYALWKYVWHTREIWQIM